MNLEYEIFKRARPDFSRLVLYGFNKDNSGYHYSKKIMEDSFRVDITIDKEGEVKGQIYDLEFGDEYTNFRLENQQGEFVNTVRDEYINILEDILDKCFTSKYFVMDQANRITKMIKDLYGDDPEFAWEDDKDDGIFRNPQNRKWYGLIMNIDKSKIDKDKGKVEVLNVKLDENKIKNLLNKKGYYPAYHMNKKNWITIILDETVEDNEIMEQVIESHRYTEKNNHHEWIVPSNPKYYDVIGHFESNDIVTWKQSSNIQVGDIVYLYVGSPYSAILYKLQVLEVNIPYMYNDDNVSMSKVMHLKLLDKYNKDEYPFAKLKSYGINAVRGPRYMPMELSKLINKR